MSIAESEAVETDAILGALVRLPAVCPLATLAETLGCDPEALADALCHLEAENVVSTWEGPDDVLGVILSPLSASRLGVHLDGAGQRWIPAGSWPRDDERPRWACETDTGEFAGLEDTSLFDLVADPRDVGGLEHLVLCEDAGRTVAGWVPPTPEPEHVAPLWRNQPDAASAKVPKPTILMGIGLVGYSPESIVARPCPGCRSIPLASTLAYCLCCDSSGVDHLLGLDRAEAEADPELPVESDERGFVVVTKGGATVKVPERFARLLKGGESVAFGPAILGHKRR